MTFSRLCRLIAASLVASIFATVPTLANPTLVVDAATGDVLYKDMATAPWYPASLTKLMTVYVALSKVREGKIALDTPMRVSAYAASMIPSKMGFRPGTLVTLDNALKMLMVKSPNDVAVTIAEGISGSVPAFATEMNDYAAKIGLHESHFMNPNGLPDPQHYSSARDMAMIARALIREFPEENGLFNIVALQFGGKIIPNHNGLLGRYPGVDGMKTGYTCDAGFNVVESATRGDRRLLVVVLGAPSVRERDLRSVALFERYFGGASSSFGNVGDLPASSIVEPPDLRKQVCGPGRHDLIAEAEAEDATIDLVPGAAAPVAPMFSRAPERADVIAAAASPAKPAAAADPLSGIASLIQPRGAVVPLQVFIGPASGSTVASVGPTEAAAPGPKAKAALPVQQATPTPAADPSQPAVATAVPEAVDPALRAPLALTGAAFAPALAAANGAVRSKGRLSLRAPGRSTARAAAAAPKVAATPAKAPVAKVAAKTQKAPVKAAVAKPKAAAQAKGKVAPKGQAAKGTGKVKKAGAK